MKFDRPIPPPPIIERAYQLARSGEFANLPEICQQLKSEGYSEISLHFDGAAICWTKGRREKVPEVWLCSAAKKEVTGTPLTLPLLRNGPSLSPLRGREVYGRCLAEIWRAKDV